MNYRGLHRKYLEGSSVYEVYRSGDVVKRGDKFYVCAVEETSGYLPEDMDSGFDIMSYFVDPSPNNIIDGGNY
jgi:hypothetical protein